MNSIELLELLTKHAKNYRKDAQTSISRNSHMNDFPSMVDVPQNAIDAVLADYINYIASKQCIDYALYTRDLTLA